MDAIARVFRQPVSTPEVRAVLQACMLSDTPCESVPVEGLAARTDDLRTGQVLPVGSVEYVRAAMRVAGVLEPGNMSYPGVLEPYLYRKVYRRAAGLVMGHWFVKPVLTKTFTGFVFDTMQDPATLGEHDLEQHNGFMATAPGDDVWISECVTWLSEVRYYVLNGKIVGEARYDADGAHDAALPQRWLVEAAVDLLAADRGPGLACAVDMGVLATGETALVEVNDAWAIGLYGQALKPAVYLEMLAARWTQLAAPVAARPY